MKERKPKVVVVLLELEDNCGAVLAKTKLEIPVTLRGNLGEDVSEHFKDVLISDEFREVVSKIFPKEIKLG